MPWVREGRGICGIFLALTASVGGVGDVGIALGAVGDWSRSRCGWS